MKTAQDFIDLFEKPRVNTKGMTIEQIVELLHNWPEYSHDELVDIADEIDIWMNDERVAYSEKVALMCSGYNEFLSMAGYFDEAKERRAERNKRLNEELIMAMDCEGEYERCPQVAKTIDVFREIAKVLEAAGVDPDCFRL